MKMLSLEQELRENAYPGRGIVVGKSADGTKAVTAYFIMGRSASSRNRVFVECGEGIKTQAFDESTLLVKPELIIYSPVRVLGNKTIVTNGDQTDTVFDGMSEGKTFEESLRVRKYEHDEPNYTPRISSVMDFENGFDYSMSILKSNNGNPDAINRYTYSYENPVAGEAHFIHTYMHDGNPLPSFEGEPKLVGVNTNDINEFTEMIWNSLNEDNKVSLFVRFIDIATGKYETKIINKNK